MTISLRSSLELPGIPNSLATGLLPFKQVFQQPARARRRECPVLYIYWYRDDSYS